MPPRLLQVVELVLELQGQEGAQAPLVSPDQVVPQLRFLRQESPKQLQVQANEEAPSKMADHLLVGDEAI